MRTQYAQREVMGRFRRVSTNDIEKGCVDLLKEIFPEEMKKIETAAEASQTTDNTTAGE
ncbi:MAG: hypothetical protein HYX40_04390 [Sphingobacteriales bacterium]|nr:hypothetical protein [Sphingobacteriales bacterium]